MTDGALLSDLDVLAAHVRPLLGEQLTLDLLGFWIPRQKEAPTGTTPLMASLRSTAAKRSGFGGGGFIEFFLGFSSDLAISLLKASAAELCFLRDRLRLDMTPDDSAEWLNDQFYERAGPHLFNVKTHPKGKRLLTVCTELLRLEEMSQMADETLPRHPSMGSLSRAEIRQTHRYLTAHTRKHFLGSFAEFLGATLAIRATGGLGAQTLIPGHSIRIANGRRGSPGPDGILGTIRTDAAGAPTLHVNALLEVKGYDPSPRSKPREQLLKHQRRMSMHGVRLSFDPASNRWISSISKNQELLIIKNIIFDDDCRHIPILPSQPVDHSDGAYSEIYLPWTGDGLRRMAAFHLREVLAQAALVVDPEEAVNDLGERAWYAALAPYETDPGFSNEDRAAIRDLIDRRRPDTLLRSRTHPKS